MGGKRSTSAHPVGRHQAELSADTCHHVAVAPLADHSHGSTLTLRGRYIMHGNLRALDNGIMIN